MTSKKLVISDYLNSFGNKKELSGMFFHIFDDINLSRHTETIEKKFSKEESIQNL